MSKDEGWTSEDMPDLTGKITIITGANSGIGYEAALALARKGATVIMACRSMGKAKQAVRKILSEVQGAKLDLLNLDLSDLVSIRQFADEFKKKYNTLDILINNAGVMMPPYTKTKDGFELQFGTNHLGHFALTGLLLDTITKTPNSRIVVTSSAVHKYGEIQFEDLNCEKSYSRIRSYAQSKLANLLFTYELQRRLEQTGSKTIVVAAHPGWSKTSLQRHSGFLRFLNPIFGQSVEHGAWPMLYAATSRSVRGGEYYGPGGCKGMRGHPKKAESNEISHDREVAAMLWKVSEELTRIKYAF
jgi:NAD(P)-dependent dehydrogenase (short-subunit alcohol dehydrogenase family)